MIFHEGPTTKDDVSITTGMRVFWRSMDPKSATVGRTIKQIDFEPEDMNDPEGPWTFWAASVDREYGMFALPSELGLYAYPSNVPE